MEAGMQARGRLFALGAALLLGLGLVGAVSGASSDANAPAHLAIEVFDPTPGATPLTVVILEATSSSPAPAMFALYAPTGYQVPAAVAPGGQIGPLFALAVLPGGASQTTLTGSLAADDPAKYTSDPAAQACAPGAHAAVWLATFNNGTTPVATMPMFVDPTAGTDTALGVYALRMCFPAALGRLAVLELGLHLTNPATAGHYVWRSILTPLGATGAADPTTAFELDSDVPLPDVLTARATFKAGVLTISGTLVAAGKPRSVTNVHFLSGATNDSTKQKDAGVAVTTSTGAFTLKKKYTQGRTARKIYFTAYVNDYLVPCTVTSPAPRGCVDQTLVPPPPRSLTATIPKKAPPKKH
jgi:hypothetical protein